MLRTEESVMSVGVINFNCISCITLGGEKMSKENKVIGEEAIYDAKGLGMPKLLVLGIQHMFAMFGATVLVPLLTLLTDTEENDLFSSSISIILPICLVCIAVTAMSVGIPFRPALPYLLGSVIGGLCAAQWGQKIPVCWLHRGLGLLILWGGYRYLC